MPRVVVATLIVLVPLACGGRHELGCEADLCASADAGDDETDLRGGDGEATDVGLKFDRPSPTPTCVGQPGEMPGVTCYPPQPDGGIYGRCREYGEEIEGKVIGAYCCGDLRKISQGEPQGDACVNHKPVSLLICAPCGDGICDTIESICNCPEDCM